jgi:hypothetical protein
MPCQSYPEAQLPVAVPPLLVHSLEVKQVPFRPELKRLDLTNQSQTPEGSFLNGFLSLRKKNHAQL